MSSWLSATKLDSRLDLLLEVRKLLRALQTNCVSQGVTNPMFKEPLRKQTGGKGIGLGLEKDNSIQGPAHLRHVGIWAGRTCCSTVFCFVLRS